MFNNDACEVLPSYRSTYLSITLVSISRDKIIVRVIKLVFRANLYISKLLGSCFLELDKKVHDKKIRNAFYLKFFCIENTIYSDGLAQQRPFFEKGKFTVTPNTNIVWNCGQVGTKLIAILYIEWF